MRSLVVIEFQLFDDLFGVNVTGESSHSDGWVLERGVERLYSKSMWAEAGKMLILFWSS